MRTPSATWCDRAGIAASTACAVHCAATPVLLALAPSLGLAAWNETWELALIVFVSVLAALTLAWGSYCHRRFRAWALLAPGLTLVWGAVAFLPEGGLHRATMVLGGLLVAGAHGMNQRLTHRQRPCDGCA